MAELGRELRQQTDLDAGPVQPYDEIFAGYDPSAHLTDDFFDNKLAFVVLLNFPLTTLDERLAEGEQLDPPAMGRNAPCRYFSKRIPAEVNLAISKAAAEAGQYISEYNIWMHHLLDAQGRALFPPKMRLLSHWNLRDEIKADYADAAERPGQAAHDPEGDGTHRHTDHSGRGHRQSAAGLESLCQRGQARGSKRFGFLLRRARSRRQCAGAEHDATCAGWEHIGASKLADPYSPNAPTLIARRFNEDRQLPEERVQKMFEQILSSPMAAQVAALIQKRLGRPLEPFDIWYNGFKPKLKYTQEELDSIVAKKYPTANAYEKDIPVLLAKLGFSPERAKFVADNIVVDPARGSGHAMGAAMHQAKAHLRTRVEKDGMNYKGFNIAVHEMGHNVEQTFSLNAIDYYSLNGVPNTAFTEALAFVFQGHDLELLGLQSADAQAEALKALNDFWATYEICGVSLVDMRAWHWMYEHPQATPEQFKDAVLQISKDVWNKFYAPVFNKKDVVLLGVYSHMIDSFLYLPDYPIGHMIAFQLEEHMKKSGKIGPEFERVARLGRLAPDLWMKSATGAPVGPDALLAAAQHALTVVKE